MRGVITTIVPVTRANTEPSMRRILSAEFAEPVFAAFLDFVLGKLVGLDSLCRLARVLPLVGRFARKQN